MLCFLEYRIFHFVLIHYITELNFDVLVLKVLHADCIVYHSIITPHAFHPSWFINVIDYLQHWWQKGIIALLHTELQMCIISSIGVTLGPKKNPSSSLSLPFSRCIALLQGLKSRMYSTETGIYILRFYFKLSSTTYSDLCVSSNENCSGLPMFQLLA